MHSIHLTIVLAPLAASIIAGLFGNTIGRSAAHWITNIADEPNVYFLIP